LNVRFINPFIESISSVFTTMLSTKTERLGLKVSDRPASEGEITALVGISGGVHGVVVLRFPPETALELASRMLGTKLSEMNDEVIDAMAEIVNMVAGSAKAKFQHDPPLQLGLPTVVEGSQYRVKYPTKSAWLEVPFQTDAGKFSMEVTFSSN
jgi:chemotaxis protein CheX